MAAALRHGPGAASADAWTTRGNVANSLGWHIERDGTGTLSFVLAYTAIDADYRREPNHHDITIDTTCPPYGGVRYWWLCPACDRRVAALYLPSGARRFLCRHCHRLAYRSRQRHEKALDPYRRMEPARRLRALDELDAHLYDRVPRVHAASSIGAVLSTISAMHRAERLYERIVATLDEPRHSRAFYEKHCGRS